MEVCQTCGSNGYSSYIIHCVYCQTAMHRYCVDGPNPFCKKEKVNWSCEDCVFNLTEDPLPSRRSEPVISMVERNAKRQKARRMWKGSVSLSMIEIPNCKIENLTRDDEYFPIPLDESKQYINEPNSRRIDRSMSTQNIDKVINQDAKKLRKGKHSRITSEYHELFVLTMKKKEELFSSRENGEHELVEEENNKDCCISSEESSKKVVALNVVKRQHEKVHEDVKSSLKHVFKEEESKNKETYITKSRCKTKQLRYEDECQVTQGTRIDSSLDVTVDENNKDCCISSEESSKKVVALNVVKRQHEKVHEDVKSCLKRVFKEKEKSKNKETYITKSRCKTKQLRYEDERQVTQGTRVDSSLDVTVDENEIHNKGSNSTSPSPKRRKFILQVDSDEERDEEELQVSKSTLEVQSSSGNTQSHIEKVTDDVATTVSMVNTDVRNRVFTQTLHKKIGDFLPKPSVIPLCEHVPVQPIIDVVWRGCCYVGFSSHCVFFNLDGHLSNVVDPKVHGGASALPRLIDFELMPRQNAWPEAFTKSPPKSDAIGLYFFPNEKRDEVKYDEVLEEMSDHHLVLVSKINNLELLVYSSKELPRGEQRFRRKYFMWGVFRPSKESFTSRMPPTIHINHIMLSMLDGFAGEHIQEGKFNSNTIGACRTTLNSSSIDRNTVHVGNMWPELTPSISLKHKLTHHRQSCDNRLV